MSAPAGTQSNLFNTGSGQVSVSFNRGTPTNINATTLPSYTPQQGFPAPGWDVGGPSLGNIGPGSNSVQIKTSNMVLPLLTIMLPNVNPVAVETYLLWIMNPDTFQTTILCVVLTQGQLLATSTVQGTATADTSTDGSPQPRSDTQRDRRS